MSPQDNPAQAFIDKWTGVTASELSTSQSFLIDLCALLEVERPHPTPEQDYLFERPITFQHGDGSSSAGRIDLYRRGAFVLESKKLRATGEAKTFDAAMLRARSQAERYARALPAAEGRPPFVIVVDVGRQIELYAEFSRSGGTYTPFPDPRSHRIALADLVRPELRERLRRVWLDPLGLDPSRESARVTREIAGRLAELARSLERAGHDAELAAQFLMRCLFTMFAEDVRLLPTNSFRDLLARKREQPELAMRLLAHLWRDMDAGGFSAVLENDVLRFNGKLFKQPDTLPLTTAQIDLLIDAARADWRHVEPAIFGTLLERALDPRERHKLGAHYTPRAYVERLVLPTVIEPLRSEWEDVKAAALMHLQAAEEERERGQASDGKKSQAERLKGYNAELAEAHNILLGFHLRLCSVRVLDPACGSGNFLYVTLEHLKRLEGEVLNAFADFGLSQRGVSDATALDLAGERAITAEAQTVDPHNLLGIEINPRAAAIAEVVLWIGYLQWHFRTRGDVNPPTPVIRDFRNIECRDAVLAYDRVELVTDERGVLVSRWDGKTTKPSPVTGEPIPDDAARVPIERYVNARKAAWPEADFVVGNPPFIGNKRMRAALGDGYVEALRGAWKDVPDTSDFVMYWWHHAAQLTRRGALQRFGLITTNSITQSFNRRVIEAALLPGRHAADVVSPTSDDAAAAASLPAPRGGGAGGGGRVLPTPQDTTRPSSGPAGHLLPAGEGKERALSLVFAIPDHPWVDSTDGAAVRIAMTVALGGAFAPSRLCSVVRESIPEDGEVSVELAEVRGVIFADLRAGSNVSATVPLRSNQSMSYQGVKLVGDGFRLDQKEIHGFLSSDHDVLREYWTGRDLTKRRVPEWVIDFFGLEKGAARETHPMAFQQVLTRVKPIRDQVSRSSHRERWWIFGEPRPGMRRALQGLNRYIATSEVAKHRVFVHLDWPRDLPDGSLMVIASQQSCHLGVLSCQIHQTWALAAGGRLGVGNDPRYNNGRCFLPFPFPAASGDQQARLRDLGERLDTHRKRQQSAHPELTLTGMYNVLEKLRSGEPLSAKERVIHEQGLVSVLRQIHDELDAAVLAAYGWSDLLPTLRIAHGNDAPPAGQSRDEAKRAFDEAVLERLVALNAERAAEEARGLVRWLRPEFQAPDQQRAPDQGRLATDEDDDAPAEIDAAPAPAAKPRPWPKDAVEQVRAVADTLAASPTALSLDQLAERFTARGPWKRRLPQLLDMLVALGRAQEDGGRYTAR